MGETSQEAPVLFWNADGTEHEYLSQWYPVSFTHDGVGYRTTEMYMMHQKALLFDDHDTAQQIASAQTPKEQKDLGRLVKNFDSRKWNLNKVAIVEQGNYLKFTQGRSRDGQTSLKELLLKTGMRELIEASPEDRIWGIGFAAKDVTSSSRANWGENLLGKALMKVRERIRAEA